MSKQFTHQFTNKKSTILNDENDKYMRDKHSSNTGLMYKKHPVYQTFAACANGDVIDVENNVPVNREQICGYQKIIVGKNQTHVILLATFIFECFFGVSPPFFHIIHSNGDTNDNRLVNLQIKNAKYMSDIDITIVSMLQKDINDHTSLLNKIYNYYEKDEKNEKDASDENDASDKHYEWYKNPLQT